ncbi:MAG: hypothetical protein MUF81_02885 [Verrucomicrobia bacterium]|jgi:hypothetical protein|nr:hypothetical protein [Verrucomicrobiota bacterium]
MAACFLLGLAAGAYWTHWLAYRQPAKANEPGDVLSKGTGAPVGKAGSEADARRAITRLAAAKPNPKTPGSATASPAQVDPAASAEVKRAIPNLDSVSLADATQTLRVAALKEFVSATGEMERAVKAAEQRVTEAQNTGSPAGLQAAVKQLQQVQARHTEILRQITARLQDQIAALHTLKGE